MPQSVARSPEFLGVAPDVDAILARLAERHSCRDFDNQPIDIATIEEIVADGTNAPSSCNQQNWHFVVVTDPALRKQAREISGGNHHFEFCSAIIYLCFLKGWTHDKFSVVQSVAGACYHMMLSAHLRGFATIWNAGIGDPRSVARMLSIPPLFEIQGALCVGRPAATAPAVKAPRRSVKEIWSHNVFKRPAHATYLAKPAPHYPFFRIHNTDNPFAEWRPDKWGWDRIGDFRGYSVWAKSPLAGVYRSRRQGDATARRRDARPLERPVRHDRGPEPVPPDQRAYPVVHVRARPVESRLAREAPSRRTAHAGGLSFEKHWPLNDQGGTTSRRPRSSQFYADWSHSGAP